MRPKPRGARWRPRSRASRWKAISRESVAASVRQAAGGAPVVELGPRNRMLLNSAAPILATYQGVWPGMAEMERAGAGPTGSAWIDTNTGFIRGMRAASDASLWIANQPPPKPW